ncbi:MAG: iron-sulfur cluster assembly protein [Acidiferrobacterales bacterium]
MTITENMVLDSLENVMDPELNHSVVKLGFIREIEIVDDYVHLDIQLTSPHCPRADEIVAMIRDAVKNLDGINDVDVERICETEA